MNEWTVTIAAATASHLDEPALVELARRAEKWDGTVGARGDTGPGFVLILDVAALDPIAAGAEAVRRATELADRVNLGVRVVQVDVKTPELAELDALRPDTPELLAASDVAELLGVSRQRVHQLHADRADFPAPYARLGSGPIWTRPAIEAFDRSWLRKPGRPAKAS
jgi:predicted DNA-binding transcriptional regulator AlpA